MTLLDKLFLRGLKEKDMEDIMQIVSFIGPRLDKTARKIFISYNRELLTEPITYIIPAICGTKSNGGLTSCQKEIYGKIAPVIRNVMGALDIGGLRKAQKYAISFLIRGYMISKITYMVEAFRNKGIIEIGSVKKPINRSNRLLSLNYFLNPGYVFVSPKPIIISTVVGSCVAVCMYDKKYKVGGMNHFQLPYVGERHKATARYGNVATRALIRMMIDNGSELKYLEAQIFGGAYNPKVSPSDVGYENIKVAKEILAKKRIHVSSEDVGGERGRKIVFNTNTCEIGLLKVKELRNRDWYPYQNDC
jgi:chemotaxis protein CheD